MGKRIVAPDDGPFVTVAAFCEGFSRDAKGAPCLSGLLNGVTFPLPADSSARAIVVRFVLSLAAGRLRGQRKIQLIWRDSTGRVLFDRYEAVEFSDDKAAELWNLGLEIDQAKDGLRWMDVLFESRLLTRVPLLVAHCSSQPSALPS